MMATTQWVPAAQVFSATDLSKQQLRQAAKRGTLWPGVHHLPGRAIAALEDQLVIDALETGATGAKSMEDGKAPFDPAHTTTTTEATLGVESLAEATKLLRSMKEVGNGLALNLAPLWLLVPATHEVQALQLCTAINATESDAVNPFGAGSLVLEPQVAANFAGSHAYVFADGGLGVHDHRGVVRIPLSAG